MYSALAFTCASFTVTPNEFQEFQPIGGRSARRVPAAAGTAIAAAATRPRRHARVDLMKPSPRKRRSGLILSSVGYAAAARAGTIARSASRNARVSSGVPIVTRSQVGMAAKRRPTRMPRASKAAMSGFTSVPVVDHHEVRLGRDDAPSVPRQLGARASGACR